MFRYILSKIKFKNNNKDKYEDNLEKKDTYPINFDKIKNYESSYEREWIPEQKKSITELKAKEAWEGWYPHHEFGDLPLDILAEIKYIDSKGNFSQRKIKTKKFLIQKDNNLNESYLLAYCYEKNSMRNFVISRIQELIDLNNGEIINDISKYLQYKYDNSSHGITKNIIEKLKSELIIFLFVAKADSRISKNERTCILNFIDREFPNSKIDKISIDQFFSISPSQKELKQAIKTILDTGRVQVVLEQINCLEKSRTKMDDFTNSAIDLIRKQLLIRKNG